MARTRKDLYREQKELIDECIREINKAVRNNLIESMTVSEVSNIDGTNYRSVTITYPKTILDQRD